LLLPLSTVFINFIHFIIDLYEKSVFRGQIQLGRVHISACEPITFGDETEPDWNAIVKETQKRQANSILISDYHINASSELLRLERGTIRRAFEALGAKFLPQRPNSFVGMSLATSSSEQLSLLLQISPILAPLFMTTRPKWSKWLCSNAADDGTQSGLEDSDVTELANALTVLFDEADRCVDTTLESLHMKGFAQPRQQHILQTALQRTNCVPGLLLNASISIRLQVNKEIRVESKRDGIISASTRVRVGTEEALGYWGFFESQFVLQIDTNGATSVRMDGSRYNLQKKRFSGLLPFISKETGIKIDPLNEAFSQAPNSLLINPSEMNSVGLELLKAAVSNVSLSTNDRIRHGTAHSQEDIFLIRSEGTLRVPDVVVWPISETEVESVIRLAKVHHWCIIPFGGGTNVSNATRCPSINVEPRPIISLDMRKMCRILWIDEENGLAHVQAGIAGRHLEEELARGGYTMGHEPDSVEFSTLGGWIATKASGMKRNKYGNIEDIVKAVRVIGPDGVLQHGPEDGRHVWGRESSGFDLKNLVLGSEGCLGVITSAFVRIWPLAETKDYDSVLLSDFREGLHFVREIEKSGSDMPVSVRLLDNEHFRFGLALRPDSDSVLTSIAQGCYKGILKWKTAFDETSVVCVTFLYEGTMAEVRRQKRTVNQIRGRYGGVRLGSASGKASYEMTFMIAYIRDFALSYYYLGESFETFAPWSQVETVVAKTKATIRKEHAIRCLPGNPFIGCRVTQLYHEGACLYFYFCMNFDGVENASSVFTEIENAARMEVLSNGGSLSHHHGVGKLRASFLPKIDSIPFRVAVNKIKQSIDPDNIFGARNGAFAMS
jgi:alkyldihydroxyacetonephosphate synthase